jgi:PAS domain S-box-containing protein
MSDTAGLPSGLENPSEQYDLLFRASPFGLVYLDESTRIIACNEVARSIFGLTEEEASGRSAYDPRWRPVREDGSFFPPESHPVSLCLRTGEEVRGVVLGLWNPGEGRYRWVSLDAFPQFSGASSKPRRVLVWVSDITERILAREAERRSQGKFRLLFDNMSEGVALHEVVDDAGGGCVDYRIVDVNRHYESQVGIARDDVVGKLGSEAYGVSPAPYLEEYCAVARGGGARQFETYFQPLDKHFLISVAPLPPSGFATIFFDISELKRHEIERERLVAELDRKNKELESIVYVASHDLRSPLVNIQGFGERLEKDCLELASQAIAAIRAGGDAEAARGLEALARERIPRSLEFIRASGSKMDKLISGLLRLSRTGRAELAFEALDMNGLMAGIAATMAFQLEKAGAVLEIGDLPPCRGDSEQLGQAFANLIDNAIKYRSPDRPLKISLRGERKGGEALYVVEDTGIGIAREHLEKVWELFYRLDPGDGAGGEGMGLTLVRRIVERHGGRAWAESEPGRGSRFIAVLPSPGEAKAGPRQKEAFHG